MCIRDRLEAVERLLQQDVGPGAPPAAAAAPPVSPAAGSTPGADGHGKAVSYTHLRAHETSAHL
eukprot:9183049-Alexandrium_andersonii.AAC.1